MLPYDPKWPVVCFDEASKQLFGEVRPPELARPGAPARVDYEYERKGVCCQLVMCEPLRGWRHVMVTERRTRKDYAQCVMVQREMEKPGSEDKVVYTLDQSTTICRFRTNPEGKDRAASCRPPSVLVPGSALGSCRHGALSLRLCHESSCAAGATFRAMHLFHQRWISGLARVAGSSSLFSHAASSLRTRSAKITCSRPANLSATRRSRFARCKRTSVQCTTNSATIRRGVVQAQRRLDPDAFALQGLVPPLDLPVALRIVG